MDARRVSAAVLSAGLVVATTAGAFAHAVPHHKVVHQVKKHVVVRHVKKGTAVRHPVKRKAVPVVKESPLARQYMKIDAKTHTVVLELLAGAAKGPGVNSGFNFNGYSKGQLKVLVPLHWHVVVDFKNVGSLPHSAVIEPKNANLSAQNPTLAFPKAETPQPTIGTPTGGTAKFTFLAAKPGAYQIVCAYPGHAALGMWDTLTVTRAGLPNIQG